MYKIVIFSSELRGITAAVVHRVLKSIHRRMWPREFIEEHCGPFRVRCACILGSIEAVLGIGFLVFSIVIPKVNSMRLYGLLAVMLLIELVLVPYILVGMYKQRKNMGWAYVGVKFTQEFMLFGTMGLCLYEWKADDSDYYKDWSSSAMQCFFVAFALNMMALFFVIQSASELLHPQNRAHEMPATQSAPCPAQQPLTK